TTGSARSPGDLAANNSARSRRCSRMRITPSCSAGPGGHSSCHPTAKRILPKRFANESNRTASMASDERKAFLLRIDPELWSELEAWAADELRSVNGQVEYLLRSAVQKRKRALATDDDEEKKR